MRLTQETLDDLGDILSDLLAHYDDAEASGTSHMEMRSAVGAPLHHRIKRCHDAVFAQILGPDNKM